MNKKLDIFILDASAGMLVNEVGRAETKFHDAKEYISEFIQPKLVANKKLEQFSLYVAGLDPSVSLGEKIDPMTQVVYQPNQYEANITRLLNKLQANLNIPHIDLLNAVDYAVSSIIKLSKNNKYFAKRITILSSIQHQNPDLDVVEQYKLTEQAGKTWEALNREGIEIEFVGIHEEDKSFDEEPYVLTLVKTLKGRVNSYKYFIEDAENNKSINTTTIKKKAETFINFGDTTKSISTQSKQQMCFRIPISVYQKKLSYKLPSTTYTNAQNLNSNNKSVSRKVVSYITEGKFNEPFPTFTAQDLATFLKCKPEQCIKVYNYEGVSINLDELNLTEVTKFNITDGINIVGFIESQFVDRSIVIDSNNMVVPRASKDVDTLNLLINSMLKHNTVALASIHLPSKTQTFSTYSCYLLPIASTATSCGYFYILALPFAEQLSVTPLPTLPGLPRILQDGELKRNFEAFQCDDIPHNTDKFDKGMQAFIKKMSLEANPGTVADFYPPLNVDEIANPSIDSVTKASYHRASLRLNANQLEPPLYIASGPTDYHKLLRPIPQDHPFLQEMNELLNNTFL